MKTLGHLARFATVGALVLGGIAVGTASASAATNNTGCRADQLDSNHNPLGYVDVGGGVHLDSCIENADGGNDFYGIIRVQEDPNSMGVFPCAQLYQGDGFGNWTEVPGGDLGCTKAGWLSGGRNGLTYNIVTPTVSGLSGGEYLVKVGFWGTPGGAPYGYYDDIESPVASLW